MALRQPLCKNQSYALVMDFQQGRSDNITIFMRSEKLALNNLRVGLEPSDAVKWTWTMFCSFGGI